MADDSGKRDNTLGKEIGLMGNIDVLNANLNVASWGNIFLVLSLEKSVRFWPDMGLSESCSYLRKASEENRIEFEQIEADESLRDDERAAGVFKVFRSTLGQVSARCGVGFVDNLVSWANTMFPKDRELIAQPLFWTQILRDAGRNRSNLSSLGVSSEKKSEIFNAILIEIINQKDLRQEVKNAEAEPRSAWDAQKFAEYTDGASPLDMVEEAVLRCRFIRLWTRVISFLTADDIRELLTWAKGEAGRMGIPADLIDVPRY